MRADTVTKDYISDTTVFSDVFNYYIYGGQQVIKPEQLTEQDPGEIALPYGADGAVVPVQKFRDAQKLCTVMTDGEVEFVLCGVENQAEVHYAMPVKNNLYDAIEYAGQVEEAAKSHRKSRKRDKESDESADVKKKLSAGEFLSGFWKEDRLIPSVTVTLYFGSEEWTGPMSLSDMMDIKDSRILSCMEDYHVKLIAPAHMEDEEIMKFQSSLREVLLFIKYSKDKERLDEILKQNEERFREVERRAVDVIEVMTHTELRYEEREGSVDMCQAIREMREEERIKGEKIGEARGEKIGEARGEARGEERQNELTKCLLHDNRLDDLKRAVEDRSYREQLFIEYGIKRI